MIYVVLGMHKSGTTLVSKCLHESGINMIDILSSDSYDAGNKFERLSFVYANLALLNKAFHDYSIDVIQVKSELTKRDKLAKQFIQNESKKLDLEYKNWGFKDPRTCLTYGAIRDIIGQHRLICVSRDPRELVNHYTSKVSFYKKPYITYKALKAWCIYNTSIVKYGKGDDVFHLRYETFINDDKTFHNLEKFIDINLVDARKKNLKRSLSSETIWFKFASVLLRLNQINVSQLNQALLKLAKIEN